MASKRPRPGPHPRPTTGVAGATAVTYSTITRARPIPRVPRDMTRTAELWMEFYCEMLTLLVDGDKGEMDNVKRVQQARVLADAALADVEARWPGVKL